MTNVRPYVMSDKQACLLIFDSNVPDYFNVVERDAFAAFLNNPRGVYFTVEQDGAVVGCGGYAKEGRGQARLTWGMVDRTQHGEGLGRLLAEYRLKDIAESSQFSETELITTPTVAPFFVKFGFVEREIVKDGVAPGMDTVQMIKKM